mgnify:CR=1 FL=1
MRLPYCLKEKLYELPNLPLSPVKITVDEIIESEIKVEIRKNIANKYVINKVTVTL